MRRLLLLRHAKAERSQPGGGDHARVLTERGRTDAEAIGAYLARHRAVPDRAAVSTATRTRETWERVAAAFDRTPPVSFNDRLYDASSQTIIEVIQETGAEAGTLLVIGHNPGMQELASILIATGDMEARERLGEGFPTAALAIVSFAANGWDSVHAHGGRLEHFVTPKSLADDMD
jgi:phosphohistidine phosphatase